MQPHVRLKAGLTDTCHEGIVTKVFEVDHVVPQGKGGTDHIGNLQLLCSHCNRIKGDKTQEYLMTQLKETTSATRA